MTGAERIAAERRRQVEAEGHDAEHDDEHGRQDLARAAACYAAPEAIYICESNQRGSFEFYDPWPWATYHDKRHDDEDYAGTRSGLSLQVRIEAPGALKTRVRELEKAGALIAAEIDRLLRIEARERERGA